MIPRWNIPHSKKILSIQLCFLCKLPGSKIQMEHPHPSQVSLSLDSCAIELISLLSNSLFLSSSSLSRARSSVSQLLRSPDVCCWPDIFLSSLALRPATSGSSSNSSILGRFTTCYINGCCVWTCKLASYFQLRNYRCAAVYQSCIQRLKSGIPITPPPTPWRRIKKLRYS